MRSHILVRIAIGFFCWAFVTEVMGGAVFLWTEIGQVSGWIAVAGAFGLLVCVACALCGFWILGEQ